MVYQGLREDKPAAEVRRPVLRPKSAAPESRPVSSKEHRSN
jgi:hypothetical protein